MEMEENKTKSGQYEKKNISEKSEGGVVQPIPVFTEQTTLHVKNC